MDTIQQGRALQTKGSALWVLDENVKSRKTSVEALALARRCGDLFAQGSALNSIAVTSRRSMMRALPSSSARNARRPVGGAQATLGSETGHRSPSAVRIVNGTNGLALSAELP